MFTGIIEITGKVHSILNTNDGKIINLLAYFVEDDIKIGDSISINGVCLTVAKRTLNQFEFYVSFKTLEVTDLDLLQVNDVINLERAALITSRLGGHIVQGHIDGIGTIKNKSIKDSGQVFEFEIEIPSNLLKYIIAKGSIAIDGISLTVVSLDINSVNLVIIPETVKKTNISFWEIGTKVNIEVDMISKYIERLSNFQHP